MLLNNVEINSNHVFLISCHFQGEVFLIYFHMYQLQKISQLTGNM